MKKATSAVLAALAAAACALNPAPGKREFSLMSEAQEIALGQEADIEIRREMGTLDDSWESIAERADKGIIKPSALAIMNGHEAGVSPVRASG